MATGQSQDTTGFWKYLAAVLAAVIVSLLGGWGAYTQANATRAAVVASALESRVTILEQRLTMTVEGIERRLTVLIEGDKELRDIMKQHGAHK